jgi:CO dehydrogenase nickel-insertion accessory protein CooC1
MKEINDKHFVHMDGTKKVLKLALDTNMNLILYGPGGYGKTELVKYTLNSLNIPFNVVVGYKNMMVEALLGIPNMKKLIEKSEYEIAFKKSPFVGAKILILEEFMDVLPETAAALKDVLTEGGYRYKGKFIESDIDIVIIITNKSPEEINDDDSIKAFYNERFPLHYRVDWEVKSAKKYHDLLTMNTNLEEDQISLLSYVFEKAKPSPRIGLAAAKIYASTNDLSTLEDIRDFAGIDLKGFSKSIDKRQKIQKFESMLRQIISISTKYRDNLGILLYIKELLDDFVLENDLTENRTMALITVRNSLNSYIKELNFEFKLNIDKQIREKIDEIFRNFK